MVQNILNWLKLGELDRHNHNQFLGGRYQINSQLGAGGFGKTFLAQDTHLPGNPQCVVKQLQPQVKDAKSLEIAKRLFDTEARVLYDLGSHQQIPRLLAHFKEKSEFYLVQEFIDGEPLNRELLLGQPWEEAKVIILLQDILQVLTFVHQQNVIHRDIKPPNLIRRRRDGKIVLIDFGAVKQVTTIMVAGKKGLTNLTISIGSQGYMPKEQLGGNPRFSSDIYAVGMIGIQALTGMHPSQLSEDPETGEIVWRHRAPQVSAELATVLDQMVRYDFRTRYANANAVWEALARLPTPSKSTQPVSVESQTDEDITSIAPQPSLATVTATAPPHSELDDDNSTEAAMSGVDSVSSIASQTQPTPQRKLIKPGLVFATLAAVGGTFWLPKMLLSSQATPKLVTPPVATQSLTVEMESPSYQPVFLNKAKKPVKLASFSLQDDFQIRNAAFDTGNLSKISQVNLTCIGDACIAGAGEGLKMSKFDSKITIKPDFAEVWYNRAQELEQLNRLDEAIAAYREAVYFRPNFADAWANLSNLLWQRGQKSQAKEAVNQALEIQPNHQYAISLSKRI